jgi:hypothetical protein
MLKLILSLCLFASVSVSSAALADAAATIDPIHAFLRDTLVGHPVKSEATLTLAGTDIVADWKATLYISNVQRGAKTVSFDQMGIINQVNHVPQADGTVLDQIVDRANSSRCELRALASFNAPAGVMVGFCHTTSGTGSDSAGNAWLLNARMEGDKLVFRTTNDIASDCYANTSTGFRMCTSKSVETWSLVGGKVTVHRAQEGFWLDDLDANTLSVRGPTTLDYQED